VRFVVSRIALAAVGDADAAEPDRKPIEVGRLAGFADRVERRAGASGSPRSADSLADGWRGRLDGATVSA
jgi:hypothetical protein